MAYDSMLEEFDRRRDAATAMGGAERVARIHERGSLDARQRIDYLFGAAVDVGQHLLDITNQVIVLTDRERGRDRCWDFIGCRPPFGQPFRQAAIEQGDIICTEHPKHPPNPGRGHAAAGGVINDDLIAIADAQRPDLGRERFFVGQHMGQVGAVEADVVDIEEHRTGNVLGGVFRPGVTLIAGQEIAGIDNTHAVGVQVIGQPFGADQGFRVGVFHMLAPGGR